MPPIDVCSLLCNDIGALGQPPCTYVLTDGGAPAVACAAYRACD